MKYSKDVLESNHVYRKIVLLLFLIKDDKILIKKIGFADNDINRIYLEFKKILLEEKYLSYVKDQEETSIEKNF